MAAEKVGQELPDVTVWEKNPEDSVKLKDACAGKKCVIVGVPGPFTPTCTASHLPGFIEAHDKLKELNVDLIACVSVCDPFVMTAWGASLSTSDKVRMWADTQMELTKALDVVLEAAAFLGNNRSQRYSMLVENNVIKAFFVEEDPGKVTVSSAEAMIKSLEA